MTVSDILEAIEPELIKRDALNTYKAKILEKYGHCPTCGQYRGSLWDLTERESTQLLEAIEHGGNSNGIPEQIRENGR